MKGGGGESGGGGWRREGGARPQAEAGRDWYAKRAGANGIYRKTITRVESNNSVFLGSLWSSQQDNV